MNMPANETEILDVFQKLGIATNEERQRALFMVNYGLSAEEPQAIRFDIGFNASLPNK